MRIAILVPALLFTSCAGIRLYDPATGRKTADITSNATGFSYAANGIEIKAITLDSSTPTTAAYGGATRLVGSVGGAVVGAMALVAPGATTAVRSLVPVGAVTAPHILTKPSSPPAVKTAAQIWP